MFSLWMLSGWAFAVVVGGIGVAVYAFFRIVGYLLDSYLDREIDKRNEEARKQ